jgi:hypothetical protein
MTRIFRILGTFKGNRQVFCDANFTSFHSMEVAMRITNNKYLSFIYGLDYDDFLKIQSNNDNNDSAEEDVDEQDRRTRLVRDAFA